MAGLQNSTMRFGTDGFAFNSQALLTSNQPWNTAAYTSIEGFTVSGSEPSGTKRRIIFKVDNNLYKFNAGSPVAYNYAGEAEDVLLYGSTVADLQAVASIPNWVGKKIYPIIALEAPVDAAALPKIKLSLKVRSVSEIYEKTVDTAEYELAADEGGVPRIVEATCSVVTTGNATTNVSCRVKDAEGVWSDWLALADVKDREGTAIQFRLFYKVTRLDGTDTAKITSVTVRHTMGAAVVSGEVAELYSIVQDYQHDLGTCYLVIKHSKLIDSRIEAFVNFMPQPKHRELIPLGVGSGTTQQFPLGVGGVKDTGIDQNSLQVFVNGLPYVGFGYNVEVSEVTVNAPAGEAVTASYDYGHGKENWLEMTKQIDQQPYLEDGTYMTRFEYTLHAEEAVDKKQSNVRIRLSRPSGRVDRESLGLANGLVQQFVLQHAAKQESIELNAEWSYDPDSQVLTVVGTKDIELIISYDFVGESQTIYSWTAGWAVSA